MEGLAIRPIEGGEEVERCAGLMSASEPWVTLRRDRETCRLFLSDPNRERYVALLDGRLAGFTILILRGAFVGFIQSVCVAPGDRNRGVGTALIRFAERRILRISPNIFLCVSSFNPRARRLYERLGYEVVGDLRDFIVPGHSEILMRKTVGPTSTYKPDED